MASRHRKDFSAAEFDTVKRFKHLLLTKNTATATHKLVHFIPYWRLSGGLWVLDSYKEKNGCIDFFPVSTIRKVSKLINGMSEGRMIALLNKFSMIALPDRRGQKFKWNNNDGGVMLIGLDNRLTADGRIGRDPTRPPKTEKPLTVLPGQQPPSPTDEPQPHFFEGRLTYRDKNYVYDENMVVICKNQTGHV
jgi:hypothetical protein